MRFDRSSRSFPATFHSDSRKPSQNPSKTPAKPPKKIPQARRSERNGTDSEADRGRRIWGEGAGRSGGEETRPLTLSFFLQRPQEWLGREEAVVVAERVGKGRAAGLYVFIEGRHGLPLRRSPALSRCMRVGLGPWARMFVTFTICCVRAGRRNVATFRFVLKKKERTYSKHLDFHAHVFTGLNSKDVNCYSHCLKLLFI